MEGKGGERRGGDGAIVTEGDHRGGGEGDLGEVTRVEEEVDEEEGKEMKEKMMMMMMMMI